MRDLNNISYLLAQFSDEVQSNYMHYLEEPYNFHSTVLLKLANSTHSYSHLLKNTNTRRYLIDLIETGLRTNMSDIIIWEYIMHLSKVSDIGQNIHRLYFDHISSTLLNLEKTYPVVHNHSRKTVETNIAVLKEQNKLYFNSDGSSIYEPLKASVRNSIRYIFSNKDSETDYHHIRLAFDLYEFYSKVEHLGLLSMFLSRRHYDDKWYANCLEKILFANDLILFYEIKLFPHTLRDASSCTKLETHLGKLNKIKSEFQQLICQ
jgi:hypothetical protein